MASSLSQTTVLDTLAAGNQNVSLIDGDFQQLINAANTLNAYANFYLDSGAVNALAITVNPGGPPNPQIITLSGGALIAGMPLAVYALNTNTGPATLTVTYNGASLGVKNITHTDWSALIPGEIVAGQMLHLIYDGTRFQLLNPSRVEEIAYAQFTANVTVSSIIEGTPTSIVSAPAVAFNGATAVVIEFFSPKIQADNGTGTLNVVLYDGGTAIGQLAYLFNGAATNYDSCLVRYRLTPSNASHTYSIGGWKNGGTNPIVSAGAGGVATLVPGYIRITRV